MRDYCGLHNHSEFSNVKIIDSINRLDRMIDYAWDIGLSGIAETEHDCLSGTLQAKSGPLNIQMKSNRLMQRCLRSQTLK